jgi:AhpD family alkylhydroperoxidase
MKPSNREPHFIFTEDEVMQKSTLARNFWLRRRDENKAVDNADNALLKRIYNVDHNAYLEGGAGGLSAKTKEMMGLVASAVLRCDDCISYHIIQCFRLGVMRAELEDALNIATVVGGTIVIPHLRRSYQLLEELYS